jgi:hypothetical protein
MNTSQSFSWKKRKTTELSKADDNSEKVVQYSVRISQILAEHTLLFEGAMNIADRVTQRLERIEQRLDR